LRKEFNMRDITQSYQFNNANACEIHEDTSFPIDEECPICIDNEDNEEIAPYKEHIEVQDRYVERLKKKLRLAEQDYKQLAMSCKDKL